MVHKFLVGIRKFLYFNSLLNLIVWSGFQAFTAPIWPYLFKSLFLSVKKKHFFHWYQKFAYRLHKEQNRTAKEDWFLHFCRCRCSQKSCHLSCYNWTYYVLICHCYFDNNKNVILTNKSSFLMHNHHHFCEKKKWHQPFNGLK